MPKRTKLPRFFTVTFETEDEMTAELNSKEYETCRVVNFVIAQDQLSRHFWTVLFERKK